MKEGSPEKRRKPKELREPDIVVPMGEFQVGQRGDILKTDALGQCVGLTLFDRQSRTGAMGHLDNPHHEIVADYTQTFLDETEADPQKVKAYLRGGAPLGSDVTGLVSDEDFADYTQHTRNDAIEGLRSTGITEKNINVRWEDDPETSVDITLYSGTGKFIEVTQSAEGDEY